MAQHPADLATNHQPPPPSTPSPLQIFSVVEKFATTPNRRTDDLTTFLQLSTFCTYCQRCLKVAQYVCVVQCVGQWWVKWVVTRGQWVCLPSNERHSPSQVSENFAANGKKPKVFNVVAPKNIVSGIHKFIKTKNGNTL